MDWIRSLIQAVEVDSDEEVQPLLHEVLESVPVPRVQLRGEGDVPAKVGPEIRTGLQGAGADEGAAEGDHLGHLAAIVLLRVGSGLLAFDRTAIFLVRFDKTSW